MKKLAVVLLLIGVVFALTQCELFSTTIEYNVSGGPASVSILYQDENGELVDVSAASPWITSFTLLNSKRPFLAFIKVTNTGAGAVLVSIKKEGTPVATDSAAPGFAVEVYAIIE